MTVPELNPLINDCSFINISRIMFPHYLKDISHKIFLFTSSSLHISFSCFEYKSICEIEFLTGNMMNRIDKIVDIINKFSISNLFLFIFCALFQAKAKERERESKQASTCRSASMYERGGKLNSVFQSFSEFNKNKVE